MATDGLRKMTMAKNSARHYKPRYYSEHVAGSERSAKAVLQRLYTFYKPKSVIDTGCGRGAWLAAAEKLGSEKLWGLDGGWVREDELLSQNIHFTAVDFEKRFEVDERYDLCISLEVAEHLPERRAPAFVDALCGLSDVVLFSAAIKYQGGISHLNEQWQSYWVKRFEANDCECFDVFRGALWEDKSVEWWYRQNLFLFVRRGAAGLDRNRLRAAQVPIIDLVHPENYEGKARQHRRLLRQTQEPTLKFCLRCIGRHIASRMKRLLRGVRAGRKEP